MLDRNHVCLSLVLAAVAGAPAVAVAAPGLTISRELVRADQPGKALESGGHGPFVCRAEQRAAARLTRVDKLDKAGDTVVTLRCPRPAGAGKASEIVQVLTLELDASIDATRRAAVERCADDFAAFKAGAGPGVFAAQARGRTVACQRAADDLGMIAFSAAQTPVLMRRPGLAQVDRPKLEKVKTPPKFPVTATARLTVPSTAPRPGDPTPRVYAARDVGLRLELGFSPLSPPPHPGGLGGPMQAVQGFLVQVADRATQPPASDPCAGFASPPGLLGVSDGMTVETTPHLSGARLTLQAELPPQQRPTGIMYVRVVPYRHAQSTIFDVEPRGERRCVVTPSDWVKVEVVPTPTPIERPPQPYKLEDVFEVGISYHPPRLWDPVGVQVDYIGGRGMNFHYPALNITQVEGCAFNPVIAANRISNERDLLEEAAALAGQIWSSTVAFYNGAQKWIAGTIAASVCGGDATCKDIVGGAIQAGMALGAGALGIPPELPDLGVLLEGGIDYLASEIASQVVAPGLTREVVRAGVAAGLRATVDAWSCPMLTASGTCDFRHDNPYTWGRPDPWWTRRPGVAYVTIRPKNAQEHARIARDEPNRMPRFGAISLFEKTGVFAIDRMLVPVPDDIPSTGINIPFVLRPSDVASPADFATRQWALDKFKLTGHDEWGNIERLQHYYDTAAILEFEAVAGLLKVVASSRTRAGHESGWVKAPRPRRKVCSWAGVI
jgi:hypothetical protein